eukprot:761706-Hanusia_phi.AAC.5
MSEEEEAKLRLQQLIRENFFAIQQEVIRKSEEEAEEGRGKGRRRRWRWRWWWWWWSRRSLRANDGTAGQGQESQRDCSNRYRKSEEDAR